MKLITLLLSLCCLTSLAKAEDELMPVARCDEPTENFTLMTIGTKDNIFDAIFSPTGEAFPIIGMISIANPHTGMDGGGAYMSLRVERDSDLNTKAFVIITPDQTNIRLLPIVGKQLVESAGKKLECYVLLQF